MKNNTLILAAFLLVSINLQAQLFPTISSVTPLSGAVGTQVTILGANFSTIPFNNTVFFGNVKAIVTFANIYGTQINVTVPPGATYSPISVTANQLTAYSSSFFDVTFPGANGISTTAFSSQVNVTGIYPRGFTTGDIDLDGKPDVVVPDRNSTSNSISILRNTGSSGSFSFAPKVVLTSGVNPTDIALGDIDGDGKLDVCVCNNNGTSLSKVSIFRNTSTVGNISFASRIDYPAHNGTQRIVVANINDDGKPDIIIANSVSGTDYFSVYGNTSTVGNISFAPILNFTPVNSPTSICVADFNSDTKNDVLVVNDGSNSFSVFKNTSVGSSISFGSNVTVSAGNIPTVATVGDFDTDGKMDVAVASYASEPIGQIRIFRSIGSNGNIAFATPIIYSINNRPLEISSGDFDGDGKVDIAATNSYSSNISIIRNISTPGNISFLPKVDFSTFSSPNYIETGDFDSDGKLDIATVHASSTSPKLNFLRNRVNEPLITSFSPTSASNGMTVAINGSNFNGSTNVKFGGVNATSFTVLSSSLINAVVANGANGTVSVSNPYATGTVSGFSYVGPRIQTTTYSTTSSEADINVFLNPSLNEINIAFLNNDEQQVSYQLMDIEGRVYLDVRYVEPASAITRKFMVEGSISAGLYFFTIKKADGAFATTKLYLSK